MLALRSGGELRQPYRSQHNPVVRTSGCRLGKGATTAAHRSIVAQRDGSYPRLASVSARPIDSAGNFGFNVVCCVIGSRVPVASNDMNRSECGICVLRRSCRSGKAGRAAFVAVLGATSGSRPTFRAAKMSGWGTEWGEDSLYDYPYTKSVRMDLE